jgi:hypothetical protein
MLAPNDVITFVKSGDEHLAKVDRPDAIVDFLESDRVGREGVGDEEQPLLEAEGAGVRDALDEEVPRILDGEEAGIVRARRGSVERGRRAAAQVLVGPLLVVRALPAAPLANDDA